MRYIFLIITFLSVLIYMSCDKTDITLNQSDSFIKFYGGPFSDNAGVDVKQANDGSYAVLATLNTPDNGTDMCLVLTDIYGNSVSEIKYFGGASNDRGKCLKILDDGGLILLGSSEDSLSGSLDILMVRTNSSGDSLWSRTFGGSGNEEAYDVKIDNAGNFILAGYTDTYEPGELITIDRFDKLAQVLILKVDPDGNIVTPVIKPFGNRNKDDIGHSLQIMDNGYLITGNTNAGTSVDNDRFYSFITRVDSTGYPQGDLYTLFETLPEYHNHFETLPDGNILVAGTTITATSSNICLAKVNSGNLKVKLWQNIIYPSGNTYNTGLIVDGNEIILAGTHIVSASNSNILMIRTQTDSVSTVIDINEYGLSSQMASAGFDLTFDGGYIFTGSNNNAGNSVITLIKTSDDGNF